MKNKFLGMLFFMLAFIFRAYCQEPDITSLSLEECIDIGLKNNLDLQRSELNLVGNEADLLEAKGQRLPSLSASTSSRYNWGRSINPVTNLFETRRIGNINLSANSSMTVYSGGQVTNSIQQAKTELRKGEFDLKATKNNITLNIINLFVNVVFAKEQLEVAKSQLEITSNQLKRTRKLVEVGSLPLSNQLDLEAQNATSEMELTNAENNLRLAKLDLSQAIQVPFQKDFGVAVPDLNAEDYWIATDNVEEAYQIAENNMPEIKSAELAVESAGYGLKVAKGNFYPSLGLGGNIFSNYVDQPDGFGDSAPFGTQVENNLSQAVGLNLNIPIFSNFRNKAGVQRARVQKQLAEVQEQEARNLLRQDIETAYTNATGALKTYQSSRKQVAALEEAFRMAQKQFEVGVINAVDFQVSQNNLFKAQADMLQAKYEYIFSVKVLDFYLGNPLTL
ncbi:TolC family protein [Echinicola jeungdonensis]|uniref:TolC family protein n=1 Tax=Echinicola jeungdonensis TaxID=709343 RepID=A0ABV5J5X8_9BACT|nr:TolC family protein [Echinicola jeungdonensis]MDN3667915.1 TolC family protein [Echinicola jeungdonensis]